MFIVLMHFDNDLKEPRVRRAVTMSLFSLCVFSLRLLEWECDENDTGLILRLMKCETTKTMIVSSWTPTSDSYFKHENAWILPQRLHERLEDLTAIVPQTHRAQMEITCCDAEISASDKPSVKVFPSLLDLWKHRKRSQVSSAFSRNIGSESFEGISLLHFFKQRFT